MRQTVALIQLFLMNVDIHHLLLKTGLYIFLLDGPAALLFADVAAELVDFGCPNDGGKLGSLLPFLN